MKTWINSLLTALALLTGCGEPSADTFSGFGNRMEIQEILDHFSGDPADSLELRAARFIASHLSGHYGFAGGRIGIYEDYLDSVYPAMPLPVRKAVLSSVYLTRKDGDSLVLIPDTEALDTDGLIAHIRNRTECYRTVPWLRGLSFTDFCDYLLPYRLDHEPLLAETDSMFNLWRSILRFHENFPSLPPTIETARWIERILSGNTDDPYRLNLLLPDQTLTFDCVEDSYYLLHSLRAAGIPCAVDFIPNWPTRNGKHYWLTIIDPSRVHNQLTAVHNPRAAKVYRKMFSRQPFPCPTLPAETVPELFADPFLSDVSSRYMRVADIELRPVKMDGISPHYLYLAVFNNLGWHPVAWAEIRQGRALFRNIGIGIVCLPVYSLEDKIVPAGPPFLTGEEGVVKTFVLSGEETADFTFHRKFPLTTDKIGWTKDLPGTVLQGADRPDFSDSVTLHRITRVNPNLGWETVVLDSARSFRYWRWYKSGRTLSFGELEFIGPDGRPVCGDILTATLDERAHEAFDGNVLTYNRSLSWIGMDFGKPVTLSAVRFIPRTDDNAIVEGELYELRFWGPGGWESHDLVEADADSVVFHDVPAGGLYWLRNLDKGKEERIFTYENGRPVYY